MHKGTISHGTMRYVDLIPTFVEYLRAYDATHDVLTDDENERIIRAVSNYDNDLDLMERHGGSVTYLLDALFDAMNDLAPDGYYFGAHPGDGSDYGFWAVDDV